MTNQQDESDQQSNQGLVKLPESMNPAFAKAFNCDVAILRWPDVGTEADPNKEDRSEHIWIETQSPLIASSGIMEFFDFLYPKGGESAPDGVKPMTWVFRLHARSGTYQTEMRTLLFHFRSLANPSEDENRVVVQDMNQAHLDRINKYYVFDRFEKFFPKT